MQYPAGYQKEKENKNEVEEETATPSKAKRKRNSQGSGKSKGYIDQPGVSSDNDTWGNLFTLCLT